MCVCVCVRMYVCMHVFMHVSNIYLLNPNSTLNPKAAVVGVCQCVYVCVCVCMYVCIYVCM